VRRGFTLTEIVVVIVVILVITAILIPCLAMARISAYNAAGAANMRAYAYAQTMYIKTDYDGGGTKEYAVPFTNLYIDASQGNKMIGLIDKAFYEATEPGRSKQGYYFSDLATIAGVAICPAGDYGLCGAPAAYRRTGTRIFVVISGGGSPRDGLMSADAANIQAGIKKDEVVKLIADYPDTARITAQQWREGK
jgi:prepilin-type N-terminal cleavage/methylation domain-containing protein